MARKATLMANAACALLLQHLFGLNNKEAPIAAITEKGIEHIERRIISTREVDTTAIKEQSSQSKASFLQLLCALYPPPTRPTMKKGSKNGLYSGSSGTWLKWCHLTWEMVGLDKGEIVFMRSLAFDLRSITERLIFCSREPLFSS